MRVISGKYKGKKLHGFDVEGTRPTMDRVKESLFGMIQSYVSDSVVLDLFAGAGTLGIEALSNGAKECYFVDNGSDIIKSLRKNIEDIEGAILFNTDYVKVIKQLSLEHKKFDIIFIDPPYNEQLISNCFQLIEDNELLNKNGIIVCEYDNDDLTNISDKFKIIKDRTYGDKKITVYRV